MSESPRGPQFDAEPEQEDDGELLAMFDRWDKGMVAHWSAWRLEAEAEYEFRDGHQWDRDDVLAMEDNGKIAVTFNLAGPTIDAVSGAEIQNRQQVQYFPREVGDTGVADALTQGAEYVNDECNGDQEDSEAFRDCLTCGIGWTETRPDVDGDQVQLVKERVDPLLMMVDPASRKACFEDARYIKREIPMSEDEFNDFKEEIGNPEATGDDGGLSAGKRLTVVNPRQRYTNGMLGQGEGDEVIVCEWQWWEREPVFVAAMPHPDQPGMTQLQSMHPDDFAKALQIKPEIKHTRTFEKVYYRALVGGGEVLFKEELYPRDPKTQKRGEGGFRYKAMTGKRDRKAGTWFGLMRSMMDPQRFTNKLYSEILHIIRTNANGGMALEEDAVSDIQQFEDSWSSTDKITWLKSGALSNVNGAKMLPKTPPPIQPALFQLMEFAKEMVRACTGVNEEILGLVEREQAGVLEHQRKQAAYGILSPFFDAERRYRRDQGKLQLTMMRRYLPADKLARIVDKGTERYVTLASTMDAAEYDIVVDESPAGPNQKARTSAVLQPLLQPLFEGDLIGADEIADSIEFMDLPAGVATKLAAGIRKHAASKVADPALAAIAQEAQRAEIDNKNADTAGKEAKAFKDATDAHATHAKLGAEFIQAATPDTKAEATPQSPGGQPPSEPAFS